MRLSAQFHFVPDKFHFMPDKAQCGFGHNVKLADYWNQ